MKKSHIFNIFSGILITIIWIYQIVANGAYPLLPLVMIVLVLILYIMERKGVDTVYWAAPTIVLLLISLWTMVPEFFFGP
ncbi:hypothetical protein ATG70_2904 [Bacillus sp. es.036]|nr:hypothetical protein ATG70_2904 [Bacillus sp. es.036]